MYDVICAGQAVLDCITRGREERPYRPNVYRAQTIRLHTGGDAVNESMALSALSRRVAIVCALGRDLAGDLLWDRLERAGVSTRRVSRMDFDTPIANLQVGEDGSRFSVNSGATRLEGYAIRPEALQGARIVSFASLFRPPLAEPEQICSLIRRAKAAGAVVCADTKLPLEPDLTLERIQEVLPLIDYFFPNEAEAAFYTGEKTVPEMAEALRNRGIRNVVIKCGPRGCYVSGEEGRFALDALPVPQVVDTTGAGDHFVAGFLSTLLDGEALHRCACAALEQAALAITRTGG